MRKHRLPVRNPHLLVRPLVRELHGYVPGEQPRIKGLIKLNTNENPFPPSPKVLAAIKAAVDGRLRLYPNPTAQGLRERLARFHGCAPENIIVGNGSDELLALATRTFVEPEPLPDRHGSVRSGERRHVTDPRPSGSGVPKPAQGVQRSTVQYFTPSYSLYPVLAAIHGARANPVPLMSDFGLPPLAELRRSATWDFKAALAFITTPNAPSGRGYATAELEAICRVHRGVIVLDEAYVDFANQNAMELALKYPNVLVARTFSKAYSLCFLRVGYFVGNAELIAALQKIRDSYNVNGLGQIAAQATLADLPHYRANFRRIIATRDRLTAGLRELGFDVLPSQTNFILAQPAVFPAKDWLEKLRARKILVRWFDDPQVQQFLRITIGSDSQADALLGVARQILK